MIGRRAFVGVLARTLLAAPLAVEAQAPGPMRTVGILGHTPAVSFETGLRDLGWVQGKNIRFERRVSTDDETLARFAAELSRVPVDVIFAGNAPSTRAAMQATRVIPIITVSADPVSTGFVASLAHPGGNVTGVAIMHTDVSGKRLEILTQALPAARRIAFLVNPNIITCYRPPAKPPAGLRERASELAPAPGPLPRLTGQNATDKDLRRQLDLYREAAARAGRPARPVLHRDIYVGESDEGARTVVGAILAGGYRGTGPSP